MTAQSLQSYLQDLLPEQLTLAKTIPPLLDAVAEIAQALRSQAVSPAGSANAFGDAQLNVDLAGEKIMRDTVQKKCPAIVCFSSEEDPVERQVDSRTQKGAGHGKEQYTLAFDPLDGSSIIDTNWTVGTIIGLWEGKSALHKAPSSKQVAAILGVHGPRVSAIVALNIPTCVTCFEITLGMDGAWVLGKTDIKLDTAAERKPKYFAPANLRAASEDSKYMSLIQHYIRERYTLRYSGGLVPDIVHSLIKGHGIYISPTNEKSKAKLRRLYETVPVALIVECAGGAAVDPKDGTDILGTSVEEEDERSGIICGTKEEVGKAVRFLGLPSP